MRTSLHLKPGRKGTKQSDTPGKAGGLMSRTASKAVALAPGVVVHPSWRCPLLHNHLPASAPSWSQEAGWTGSSSPPTGETPYPHAQPCCPVPWRSRLPHYRLPPEEHSTPGTLKAVQVALVKPVAYLKDRVNQSLSHY